MFTFSQLKLWDLRAKACVQNYRGHVNEITHKLPFYLDPTESLMFAGENHLNHLYCHCCILVSDLEANEDYNKVVLWCNFNSYKLNVYNEVCYIAEYFLPTVGALIDYFDVT